MDKTMDYYNCYSPLCPRRETCILWLNALECVERGENLLCVINPKILEAAPEATIIAPSITSTNSDNSLGV